MTGARPEEKRAMTDSSPAAPGPASPPAFPIDEVARQPLPGMIAPGEFAFSPDDRLITFLWSREGSLTRQLYQLDPATGAQRLLVAPPGGGTTEATVSPEEALRRERQRMLAVGVTGYAWAKKASRVLVPLRGAIYVLGVSGETAEKDALREVVPSGAAPAL